MASISSVKADNLNFVHDHSKSAATAAPATPNVTSHQIWKLHTLAALSEDGSRIVITTGYRDANSAQVWDVATNERLATIRSKSGKIKTLAVSSRNNIVVFACADAAIEMWNLTTGHLICLLHDGLITSAGFERSSKQPELFTVTPRGRVSVWDITNRSRLCTLIHGDDFAKAAQSSATHVCRRGLLVVLASNEGFVGVYVADKRKLLWKHGLKGEIRSLMCTEPMGPLYVLACSEWEVVLFHETTGAVVARVDDPSGGIRGSLVTSDSKHIVIATVEGIELRSISEPQTIISRIDFTNPILSLKYSADGTHLALVFDNHITVLNSSALNSTGISFSRSDVPTHPTDINEVNASTIDPSASRVISGYFQIIIVWDLHSKRSHCLRGHQGEINLLSISSNRQYLISACDHQIVCVWDLNSNRLVGTITKDACRVLSIALNSDGTRCLLGLSNNTAELWNVTSPSPSLSMVLREYHDDEPEDGEITSVSFSAEGSMAFTSSNNYTMRVWNLSNGQYNPTIGPGSHRNRMAIHSSGGWVQASGEKVKVSSPRSLSTTHTFLHKNWVRAVAISEDYTRVASVDWEGVISVLDITRKQKRPLFGKSAKETPIATLEGPVGGGVRDVHLSSDGKIVVAALNDGTVSMWNVGSGRLVWSLELTVEGEAVGATGDGKRVSFGVMSVLGDER
ncbi:wD repeat domain [Rhizophlyctis rosea]|uniref:WD repeat domain n=1 Tax=Rhizophlyctis rosea TaxID=64517 RepID=A0AAD5X2R5_9FUNG|nr:wD repeat domain [Rhizophlyctis rosea]